MRLKPNLINYILAYFIFILFIYLFKINSTPNLIWCLDNKAFCESNGIHFSNDLLVYYNAYKGGRDISIFDFTTGALIYKIFDITRNWVNFSNFLIFFKIFFYSALFFCGKTLINNLSIKFILFLFLIFFFPFYEGYSTFGLRQGLGFIFFIINFFMVKNFLSLTGILLFTLSVLSHPIFIIIYIILFVSWFINSQLLFSMFVVCLVFYSLSLNYIIFQGLEYLFINHNLGDIINLLSGSFYKINYDYLIFTMIPFFMMLFRNLRNLLFNNRVCKRFIKFYLLYSAITFTFFGFHDQFNRIIVIIWNLYPLMFFIFINQINKNNLKKILVYKFKHNKFNLFFK